jgi:MarR family transcriptional regulator for hemolysin
MTYPQFGALMALVRKDDITQRELAELLETDTTTAMVLCDSLQKKGWLERKRDKADRRVNRLVLTEAGRDSCARALSLIRGGYEHAFSKVSLEKVNEVTPFLEGLYQSIKEVSSGDMAKEVN